MFKCVQYKRPQENIKNKKSAMASLRATGFVYWIKCRILNIKYRHYEYY